MNSFVYFFGPLLITVRLVDGGGVRPPKGFILRVGGRIFLSWLWFCIHLLKGSVRVYVSADGIWYISILYYLCN